VLILLFAALSCCLVTAQIAKDPGKFTVSFISTGSGVDYKAETRFIDFLKKFQQEHKIDSLYKISRWGKEGETDYNFNVGKLSPALRKELRESIVKMFEDNALVSIQDKPTH